MEENRTHHRVLRVVGIACLLVLTMTTWQFVGQTKTAHAATSPSTIFLDTATNNTIPVKTTNSSGTISYTITNFAGKQVGSGGPLTVSGGLVTVTLPQEPDDYYTLNVRDNTVSPANTQQISFTVVAPFTPSSSSQFGIGTHFRDGQDPNLDPVIQTMGTDFIRDDMTWQYIEETPGVYDFSAEDPWMNSLQQQGLAPLVILDYNNTNYDGGNFPTDTAGLTAFANYAKAVVTHYPQIEYVEVYNEYSGSAADYVNLAKYAYQAVKSVRSSITVIGGSVGGGGVALSWETSLFQAGLLSYLDGLSIHPYTSGQTAAPETGPIDQEVVSVQNLIKQYNNGQAKPIWVTELGWAGDPITEAPYVVRGGVLALAGGAQKYFVYTFYLDGNFNVINAPDAAGSYIPKPAYTSYAVMARQLNGLSYVSNETAGTNVYDELFSNNTRVLWTTGDSQLVTLATNNQLTLTTMMGETQTLTPINGSVTLVLTGTPVYVHGSLSSVTILTPTPSFHTSFETSDPQPTWTNTPDSPPAGGISNVTGVCCNLSGPELGVRTGNDPLPPHTGSNALLYSGKATNASGANYAYLKAFDFSRHPLIVEPATTLSYWIDPESSAQSYGYATGNNSTCVAIDLIFGDGTTLRDSGAVDQHGNRAHPAYQCNHLTLDTWNLVTVNLGAYVSGKAIVRLNVGYDQSGVTGGYRGYIDDISIPFATGFENGDPQPTWISTPDSPPAGGISNVTGLCCGLSGPGTTIDNGNPGSPHTGSYALLYSGLATNSSGSDYAYLKVFDLSSQSLTVDANTTLSYWIYPESPAQSYGYASGSNSTCAAVDLIFSDGSTLRDSGAVDQHGIRAHPAYQCNHLMLDTWNQITVNLGAYVSGRTVVRLNVGYDQPNITGGYRGYIDDISIGG